MFSIVVMAIFLELLIPPILYNLLDFKSAKDYILQIAGVLQDKLNNPMRKSYELFLRGGIIVLIVLFVSITFGYGLQAIFSGFILGKMVLFFVVLSTLVYMKNVGLLLQQVMISSVSGNVFATNSQQNLFRRYYQNLDDVINSAILDGVLSLIFLLVGPTIYYVLFGMAGGLFFFSMVVIVFSTRFFNSINSKFLYIPIKVLDIFAFIPIVLVTLIIWLLIILNTGFRCSSQFKLFINDYRKIPIFLGGFATVAFVILIRGSLGGAQLYGENIIEINFIGYGNETNQVSTAKVSLNYVRVIAWIYAFSMLLFSVFI